MTDPTIPYKTFTIYFQVWINKKVQHHRIDVKALSKNRAISGVKYDCFRLTGNRAFHVSNVRPKEAIGFHTGFPPANNGWKVTLPDPTYGGGYV